jgi:hypothetical protein
VRCKGEKQIRVASELSTRIPSRSHTYYTATL